ncbi:MAG TPA: beta-ketoacyl synthase N-terminal-like domain-containing protein [Malonomonas sp.]
MSAMQINGLGLVGGFGCGAEDLRLALQQKHAPISQVELRGQLFPLLRADTAPLESYLPKKALRRIDHFSRLALLGAFQAMADADLGEFDPNRLGVVIGSGYGALATTFKFLDSLLDDGDSCASPTAFSNSVHNAAAAHISLQLNLTGPSLTLSQFDQSLVSGLIAAQQWLAEKRVDAVLLGVVDEYCSVLGYCWQRYLAAQSAGPMQPLDFLRTSAVAGEGAAFFLLQADTGAKPRYGKITGVEMGNLSGSRPQIDPDQPLILGCEGHPLSGAIYRQQLAATQPIACYTPLYGASPVTQGFDLAVAALTLQQQQLFPSTDTGGGYYSGSVVNASPACSSLSCLRFGLSGEYAAIHLTKD